MKLLNKTLLAATIGLLSTSVMAGTVYPDFTVDPDLTANTYAPFVADKMTGNYVEVIDFSSTGNNFTASIQWQAGQYVANDGTLPLTAGATRLGVNYGLYGLFTATGTYDNVSDPTKTSFNFASSAIQLYYDAGVDTVLSAPASAANPWTGTDGNDVLLATGVKVGPNSTTGNGGSFINGCTGGLNCGSFGTTDTFALTAAGSTFFTAPIPFYNVTLSAGQFNAFPVSPGLKVINNGSADFIFAKVPEPTTLALMGLGLMGLGLRNRKQA